MNLKSLNKETNTPPIAEDQRVLLFDGVCNLCNSFVQFVIIRDEKSIYSFASLQSEIGKQLLQRYNLSEDLKTVVLIENQKAYTQSDVPLMVGQTLGGWMAIARLGWLVPKFIRDAIYDFIAKNRYHFFGKKEACMMPRPEWKNRFLETVKEP